ncbi:MAG: prepilin-type N-terminal cleavage/methylation domain-containing protein [Planctomycetota bacterium]|jgi:prepilin-type N-terminal cleavage/methylation domain-containing protein
MSQKRKQPGGFTLVELVAVVVILGLMLTFVTLRLDGLTATSRLRASAREVGALIGVAFSSAVSSGSTRSLCFDMETGEYWVGRRLDAPREEAESLQTLYEDVEIRDIQIGQQLYEERGVLSMEISPLGIGTDALIHLRSETGEEMTLEVRPLTGTVRFHEGYVEYEEPEIEND